MNLAGESLSLTLWSFSMHPIPLAEGDRPSLDGLGTLAL